VRGQRYQITAIRKRKNSKIRVNTEFAESTEFTEKSGEEVQECELSWLGLGRLERGGYGGEEVDQFVVEEGPVGGVHGDDLEGHSLSFMNAADDGAAADLSCRSIQQKLHGTADRHRVMSADEEAAEGEVAQVGDVAGHAGLPGDEEGSRGTDAGIFALVVRRHKEHQTSPVSLD